MNLENSVVHARIDRYRCWTPISRVARQVLYHLVETGRAYWQHTDVEFGGFTSGLYCYLAQRFERLL